MQRFIIIFLYSFTLVLSDSIGLMSDGLSLVILNFHLGDAVILALLEADVVLNQELYELCLVVLG